VKDAKHLEGKLWELRLIGRDGIARVICMTVTGQEVVLLRAFVKKTQKTPSGDLAIARERAKSLD
jgi:phage-related protein